MNTWYRILCQVLGLLWGLGSLFLWGMRLWPDAAFVSAAAPAVSLLALLALPSVQPVLFLVLCYLHFSAGGTLKAFAPTVFRTVLCFLLHFIFLALCGMGG